MIMKLNFVAIIKIMYGTELSCNDSYLFISSGLLQVSSIFTKTTLYL